MTCGSTDFHQKSFRIKHDDNKFFTRLLSKETSKSDPSFRVYYGNVPSAVPFMWETRPGTPKHDSSVNSHVPPLTPPPSYNTNNFSNNSTKHSRSKMLFHAILRRMNPKKAHLASSHSSSSSLSSLSWSSSSQSSFSDPTMTPTNSHKRRRFTSWGSSFDERAMDHDRPDEMCPSRLCFGIGKEDNGDRLHGGCFVKKALLSIVGRGSA